MAKRGSRMHEGLVGARALVGTPYLGDDKLRAQYAAQIAPRTEAMLNRVLSMHLPQLRPQRVLDLGAGTGIVGTTLKARFGQNVHVTGVDRVAAPGLIAADLSRAVRPSGVQGRFDFVVAAHLLNELQSLTPAARAQLVLFWIREYAETGAPVLLIEPALKETSRALLQVRDALVGAGVFVQAPCLIQSPCPALASPKDWCHDSAPRPSLSRADFSFLLLSSHPPVAAAPEVLRVVSDVKREKGRQRLFACGALGRQPYVLQSRDVVAGNEAFLRLSRGDLCRITGTRATGDGLRLDAQSQVQALATIPGV